MNGVDWMIIGAIALSAILAAAQGFFYELFSLAGTVLGFLLAAWEYAALAPRFLPYVKSMAVAEVAAFLAIFFGVLILASVVARLARWAVTGVGLRWVDRLLGAAFGLARGLLIVTVAITAMTAFAPGSKWIADSQLSRYFLQSGRVAVWMAPAALRKQFDEGINIVRQLRQTDAQTNKK